MSAASAGRSDTAADPTMEDILASIRRILDEDATQPGADPASEPFALTEAMLLEEPPAAPAEGPVLVTPAGDVPASDHAAPPTASGSSSAMTDTKPAHDSLIAPEAAAATAATVGNLLRAVSQDRRAVVHGSGGSPTIEDVVRSEVATLLRAWLGDHPSPVAERLAREELRGLLREWLDVNLAPLVERTVRAEIERVMHRGA